MEQGVGDKLSRKDGRVEKKGNSVLWKQTGTIAPV